MGVAKPFTIETMPTFAKKGDVRGFFSGMLAQYKDGERVSETDAAHLRALLQHHTECEEKVGVGIDFFKVDENTQHKQVTRGFWIVRIDGSVDDFSFHHCITPKKLPIPPV